MAQLTDDCFAFAGPLLPVDEVERIIGERVTAVAETEIVPLKAASLRVLARDSADGMASAFMSEAIRLGRERHISDGKLNAAAMAASGAMAPPNT